MKSEEQIKQKRDKIDTSGSDYKFGFWFALHNVANFLMSESAVKDRLSFSKTLKVSRFRSGVIDGYEWVLGE